MKEMITSLGFLYDKVSNRIHQYQCDIESGRDKKKYDDVRETGAKLERMLCVECDLNEEIDKLRETPIPEPQQGEYYCLKDSYKQPGRHLMVVLKTEQPTVQLEGRYPTFTAGVVRMEALTVDGAVKERGLDRYYSHGEFARMWGKGTMQSAPYILKLDHMADEDIERVIPLLPFVPVPEGKHLNRYLLRQLARQVKRTHIRKLKEEGKSK